jgi:hypothetical protein
MRLRLLAVRMRPHCPLWCSRESQQRRLIYLARLIDLHMGTLMQFNEIYGNDMFNVNQRGRFLADFYVRWVPTVTPLPHTRTQPLP